MRTIYQTKNFSVVRVDHTVQVRFRGCLISVTDRGDWRQAIRDARQAVLDLQSVVVRGNERTLTKEGT